MCFYCICQLMKLKSVTMKATVVHFRVVLHVIKLFIFVKSKGSGQNIRLVNQFLSFPKNQGDIFPGALHFDLLRMVILVLLLVKIC